MLVCEGLSEVYNWEKRDSKVSNFCSRAITYSPILFCIFISVLTPVVSAKIFAMTLPVLFNFFWLFA